MYSVFTPTFGNQSRTARAMNSAPLSDKLPVAQMLEKELENASLKAAYTVTNGNK